MIRSRSNPARRDLLSFALLAGLGACAQGPAGPGAIGQAATAEAPMTAEQYRSVQAMLRRDPGLEPTVVRGCLGKMSRAPREELLGLAVLLDVPSAEAPQVLCERIVAAMKQERLSYDDYLAMKRDSKDEVIVRRVVRILRDPDLSPTI